VRRSRARPSGAQKAQRGGGQKQPGRHISSSPGIWRGRNFQATIPSEKKTSTAEEQGREYVWDQNLGGFFKNNVGLTRNEQPTQKGPPAATWQFYGAPGNVDLSWRNQRNDAIESA